MKCSAPYTVPLGPRFCFPANPWSPPQEVEHVSLPAARALLEQHLEAIQKSIGQPDVLQMKTTIQGRVGELQAWIAHCRRNPNMVPNLPAPI